MPEGAVLPPPPGTLRAPVTVLMLAACLFFGRLASINARPEGEPPAAAAPTGPRPDIATPGNAFEAAPAGFGPGRRAGDGARADPRPAEQPPEIYYLPDDSGGLVPVPGFRYRDFVDLLTLQTGLPGVPRPPEAVIDRLQIAARPRVDGDEQSCDIIATLTLRQLREGTVEVALGLNGLILAAAPVSEGPGRVVVEVARRGAGMSPEGYRGWVTGERDAVHTLTLTGRVPLESTPDWETFTLDLPVATTSTCTIRSTRPDAVASIKPAGLPPRVEPAGDEGSTLTCEGLGGLTSFRITGRGTVAAPGGALPQVAVESLVRIDGRVAMIDATVRIEGLPPGTSTVRIGLPPRAGLIRVREPAVLMEDQSAGDADLDPAASIEVQVGRASDGAAIVEIECERPVDPSGRTPFDPLGFMVEGVPGWRQRGRTAFVVAGEWQLDWDDPAPNRRVDPPPAARLPGFVAAFAHDAQPARLPMRVLPRASRVVVEPEYLYTIGTTRIGLTAKFRVSVRGAPVTRLTLALDGWTVDEAGPAAVVDAAALMTRDGEVVIPFLQPVTGDAVVELRAARTIDRTSDRLEWELPVPLADLVGPATVTVTSDADIEVLPDGERIRGLVRQVVPASRRPDGDRAPLVYRLDGELGQFAATTRSLPRRVEVAATVRATVGEKETAVEEILRLDVAHVPLESIDLIVPAGLAAEGTLEVLQGGQVLSPFELTPGDTDPAATAGILFRSLLATPLLGEGELTLRWTLPTPTAAEEAAVFGLPLVVPRGVRITRQSFTLLADESLAVDVRGDAWKRDAAPTTSVTQRTWVSTRPQETITLGLSAPRAAGVGETVVEAAWIETRLLADRREDLFTYALSTTGRRLVLVLPSSLLPWRDGAIDPLGIDVRVDGVPVPGAVRQDGTMTLEQPRAAGGGRTSSLVRIATSRSLGHDGTGGRHWLTGGLIGPITLLAPQFPEGTLQRRFYWEVWLAEHEHVVAAPTRWTPQQDWEWGTLGLHRVPVVSRGVLAEWVAAAARSAVPRSVGTADAAKGGEPGRASAALDPPLVAGRALFAGTGAPGVGSVWVAPTWLLVLAVSGPLLALGLAMVYRPGWRRLPAVFALVLPATLAAVAFPDLAPLVVQAAIPGIALSLLAGALRRATESDAGIGPAPRPRSGTESSTRMASTPSLLVNTDSSPDNVTSPAGRAAS
jgi:hypothetical protein